jgi:endonuclease/exonuclease/phosphatase family metal-dependent hydrolase
MPLKLISLNIEAHNHLDVILPWLQQEQADVVCLQEVFQTDLSKFEQSLGMKGEFTPLLNITKPNDYRLDPLGLWGLAMLTNLPHSEFQSEYYLKNGSGVSELINGQPNSADRAVLWTTVTKAEQDFTIANTHFTWSPAGNQIPLQETTYQAMLEVLTKIPELVLCGDFNSPRGKGSIYDKLANRYQDNIPTDISTTIDGKLHRAGHLQLVVDGLFTSPKYQVENVQIVGGLSDHMAIVANLVKQQQN